MSVLINMEMPKCCAECWAEENYGDYPVCLITGEQVGYRFKRREERMDNCPLIPVPKHGRLGDLDALITTFCEWGTRLERGRKLVITMSEAKQAIVDIIEDAPAIIPAEEEEA